MKLIVKRNQQAQTGMFGGHKGMSFLLTYRVELTPDEKALVAKYKAENELLTSAIDKKGERSIPVFVSTIQQGVSQETKDITTLLQAEEEVKTVCQNFKALLQVMATFGGEEVLEF